MYQIPVFEIRPEPDSARLLKTWPELDSLLLVLDALYIPQTGTNAKQMISYITVLIKNINSLLSPRP